MITLVVASRNRSYTLQKVLPSYFAQEGVTELILVDDDGDDDTETVSRAHASRYPRVKFRYIRNSIRRGASYSRGEGARQANNPYILFCDDDEYLELGYAADCLKLLKDEGVGAASGRRVYMRNGEAPAQAIARFGNGSRTRGYFDQLLLEIVNGARFEGVLSVPFTIANFLTRKDLVLRFPFDGHYARGNGYREESDYQMNLYVNGYTILVTNDTHSIHLPMSSVRSGGQRVSVWRKFVWSVYYNNYFINKYISGFRERSGTWAPSWMVKTLGAIFLFWRWFLRPSIYRLVTGVINLRSAS